MPAPIDYEMVTVTFRDLLDRYLRDQAAREGQTKFAALIGTKRQGVNAILNRKRGAKFTIDHLNKYAINKNIPASKLCAELARLAWSLESELDKIRPASTREPEPQAGENSDDAVWEIAAILQELLQQRKKPK